MFPVFTEQRERREEGGSDRRVERSECGGEAGVRPHQGEHLMALIAPLRDVPLDTPTIVGEHLD